MLYTNLIHLETAADLHEIIRENENVVVVCGRMDPQCVPVYRIAEVLEKVFGEVKFCDMEFDNPESLAIRNLNQVVGLNQIPLVACYKNGELVETSSGIQTRDQVTEMMYAAFKIKAEKGQTLKDVAEENNMAPKDIYDLIKVK